MSMTGKYKSEIVLDTDQLAAWLRGLADAVAAGELPVGTGEAAPVSLEGYKSLKIGFKQAPEGRVKAKVSVKFPKPPCPVCGVAGEAVAPEGEAAEAPAEAPGEAQGGLPKYKSLKKHMKQTFKAIGLALSAGQTPPELEARSFLADSRLMVSYAGKGDEFYGAYLEKAVAFEAALNGSDLEAMKALYQDLAMLKRECHSRHA